MKNKKLKVFITLIMVILLTSIMTVSKAETYPFTFTVNPTQVNVKAGETITIDLGIADIDQSTDGITSVQGVLSYDESVFENVEIITTEANWTVTLNKENNSDLKGTFVITDMNSVKNTQVVAKLKATIKSDVKTSTSIINFKNVVSSYGQTDSAKSDKTITVNITQTDSGISQGNTIDDIVTAGTVKGSNKLPQTGINNGIIIAILVVAVLGIIGYVKYKKMKI